MGRRGKFLLRSAVKNGQAGEVRPEKESAPPCSNRCAKDCTAGAFDISANKLLAATMTAFCVKRKESRSKGHVRQATPAIKVIPRKYVVFLF
jgi:hypothetical protein